MSQQRTKFESIFQEGRRRYEKKTGQQLDVTLLATMSTVADIVAAGSSAGFPPAGACLGAVALLVKSAQDVSAHYDRIVDLFDMLASTMSRFDLHDLENTSPQLEENFANVLATILEMIGYSTKAISRKRWKEYMARRAEDRGTAHASGKTCARWQYTQCQRDYSTRRFGVDVVDVKHASRITIAATPVQMRYERNAFLKLLPAFQEAINLNISILLLGRPYLTHSLEVSAYNIPSPMATVHINMNKSRDDLAKFVEEGVARRLRLDGVTDDLKHFVQETIEEKAQGMFLWANLMLEILKWQTTEADVRRSLATAPTGIDDMIIDVLKVLSLEDKLRDTYASLIGVFRDDGLSTGELMKDGTMTGRSTPTTTTVGFAHAAITEFFQSPSGKFSKGPTSIPIGVIHHEADTTLWRTCLKVFVDPGSGGLLESSKLLQAYVKHNWITHVEASLMSQPNITIDTRTPSEHAEIVNLLYPFLSNNVIIRDWCHGIPWTFYNGNMIAAIVDSVTACSKQHPASILRQVQLWVSDCESNPTKVFLPLVRISVTECLHGTWTALTSLSVVAQVKALVDGGDTPDTIQTPVPSEVLISAARCIGLEETAPWHRKLALVLRNAKHHTEAIAHFERALELDSELVEARGGLAVVYEEQGHFNKVIELELQKVQILSKRGNTDGTSRGELTALLGRKDLSRCYEMIANAHQEMQDSRMALRYWRKAAETGEVAIWATSQYLELLASSPSNTRWQETTELFQFLQHCRRSEGYDRLMAMMFWKIWPENQQPEFYFMIATAAQETGQLSWLVQALEAAITSAEWRSNLSVFILKLNLALLLEKYAYDYRRAEKLLEEIVHVASIKHQTPIEELERCKKVVARSFCHISIRKSAEAGRNDCAKHYLYTVLALFNSGLEPQDPTKKIVYGEHTHVYLALLHRLNGSIEDAARVLQPLMARCCDLAGEGFLSCAIGIWSLAEPLLTLGETKNATDLLNYVLCTHGWGCDGCGEHTSGNTSTCICQYCFESFCDTCRKGLASPRLTRFCFEGHSVLTLKSSSQGVPRDEIVFRGERIALNDCLVLLKEQWDCGSGGSSST
ncbi:hypothetical protein CC86DRAFT_403770 [Ophiobolus disseminans]|uniref:Fungal STAND N-terminal Goodbye domain-containing protein n=1 Tax=Ophiobolus disseminans TaxID=1469910 RepID=A0A6A7A7G6_9PLEO|nr:hypothetical protein CC86DRAFT_403770 [Ophiobolus disseminans]